MGGNAQRRRSLKLVARSERTLAKPRTKGDTKTMTRLRARMAEVVTLQQFEEIIAQAQPDDRGKLRKFLEPMLRDGLPCCGPGQLAHALHAQGKTVTFEHGSLCPSRNLVVIAHG